jgi:hypothetical protein
LSSVLQPSVLIRNGNRKMSAYNIVEASKHHICDRNCTEISRAFSMACQVYYKVRFRIDVVRFWLQSKHTLDPSVEKTYCVVTKHWKRTGSTYFLALCLYTNHLFHIQHPLSPSTLGLCTNTLYFPTEGVKDKHIFRFHR